jgi:hypothetical protein
MARDIYHKHVKEALEKEGWKITADPFILTYAETRLDVDLGAEKLIEATRDSKKILVEVKSFTGQSVTYEFHSAVGQFCHYLLAMEEQKSDRLLYLAVPDPVYREHFHKAFFQASVKRNNLRIIVFEPATKTITKWIN